MILFIFDEYQRVSLPDEMICVYKKCFVYHMTQLFLSTYTQRTLHPTTQTLISTPMSVASLFTGARKYTILDAHQQVLCSENVGYAQDGLLCSVEMK